MKGLLSSNVSGIPQSCKSRLISERKDKYANREISLDGLNNPLKKNSKVRNDFSFKQTSFLLLNFPVFNNVLMPGTNNKIRYLINNCNILGLSDADKKKVTYDNIYNCRVVFYKPTNEYVLREEINNERYNGQIIFGAELLRKILRENLTLEFLDDAIKSVLLGTLNFNGDSFELTEDKEEGQEIIDGYMIPKYQDINKAKVMLADGMRKNSSKLKFLLLLKASKLKGQNNQEILNVFQDYLFILPQGFRPEFDDRDDKLTKAYDDVIRINNGIGLSLDNATTDCNQIIRNYLYLVNKVNTVQYLELDNDPQYKPVYSRLKGKKGLIRDSVLGCRIDYSCRSVITIDQNLPIGTVGIPFKILWPLLESIARDELNDSFVASELRQKLQENGLYDTSDEDTLVEKVYGSNVEVKKIYAEILIRDRYCIIGRQPTLYYLSLQARRMKIIEGSSITISPLDTPPFNADFDGDQMYIQIPITPGGQLDAEIMYKHRFKKPKNGKLAIELRQEITYGICQYLIEGVNKFNVDDSIDTSDMKLLKELKSKNPTSYIAELLETNESEVKPNQSKLNDLIESFYTKKVPNISGNTDLNTFIKNITRIVSIGFLCSKLYAPNILISETIEPNIDILKDIEKYRMYYEAGLLKEEDYKSVVNGMIMNSNINLSPSVIKNSHDWPKIITSKAKGSMSNVRQLMVAKGVIDVPESTVPNGILSNIADGLSVSELFLAAHGSRQGLISKVMGPSIPGDIERRLSYNSSNIFIQSQNCGSEEGLKINKEILEDCITGYMYNTGDALYNETYKILLQFCGRYTVRRYVSGNAYVDENVLLNKDNIRVLVDLILEGKEVEIHSPIYCFDKCCQKCYGQDIRTNKLVDLNSRIGYIAAQAVSEPGTQMVMKKFQKGGIQKTDDSHGLDEGFQDLKGTYNLTEDVLDQYKRRCNGYDFDKIISRIVFDIYDVYIKSGEDVNIKHIEVVVSGMVRYIDLSSNIGRIYLKKPDNVNYVRFISGITDCIRNDSNSLYRNMFEDFSDSLFNSILEDSVYGEGEDRLICDVALGQIGK